MIKKMFPCILILMALWACHQNTEDKNVKNDSQLIRVGVFDTNGDSPGCITDAIEALRIDASIKPELIGAATIMSDDIMSFDLILFPGGSGKAETIKLGQRGMERVKDLVVNHGKGVLGICAGAYVLSQTEGYPSLGLSGFKAIDIEHDHRGHGLVMFSLTEQGKKIFPELADKDTCYSKYYEGPVLTMPSQPLFQGQSLSTMLSDVHTVEGTPSNMTNNRPFITTAQAGKGRVVTFVGHPENTPGMRWMIPRMVRWALDKELVAYTDDVVRPYIYQKEILYTKERLEKQDEYFQMLWGNADEKIEAINQLVQLSSWSAKKKVIGLLRDGNSRVRLAAAKAIIDLERTDALIDLEVAVDTENDELVKLEMETLLLKLKAMIAAQP